MEPTDFEIHGQWPSVDGEVLDALLCQEYHYGGVLADPANVIYFRVSSVWYRLTLDCGVILWHVAKAGPETLVVHEIKAEYKIIDLGRKCSVVGSEIKAIEPIPIQRGVGVSMSFSDGRKIIFRNQDDVTTYET
ncbi:MAG: hypothetical protein OEY86_03335 [Nitrospira sp.]|nr:hypothetical protein [Nitrospira sp.]